SGKRRPGVAVAFELLRRTWSTVLRGAGESAATHESRVVDEVVERCNVTTRAEVAATCGLTTKAAGYHIVRAAARDARGNPVAASYATYVLAPKEKGKEGAGPGWSMSDTAKLDLVA